MPRSCEALRPAGRGVRLLAEMSTAVDINVVSRVAIWPKNGPSLDEPALEVIDFELDSLKTCIAGRPRVEFGTVRPRVQIPGPRPSFFKLESRSRRLPAVAMSTVDDNWQTLGCVASPRSINPGIRRPEAAAHLLCRR